MWKLAGIVAIVGSALAMGTGVAAANADDEPEITRLPTVVGTMRVGEELRAEDARWTGEAPLYVSWAWLSCGGKSLESCRAIDGATRPTYRTTQADFDRRLRAVVTVRNEEGHAWGASAPSERIAETLPAPPAPEPVPSPTPAVELPPVQFETPPPVIGQVLGAAAEPPRMLRPFPLVRIRGRLTPGGARITLLTVRAPRGARIALRCHGRSCPARRWAKAATLTRVLRFQRRLAAGTRLVITVTRRGRIGKHTTIAIRRGRPPLRRDRCLYPGSRRAVRCPAR